MSDNNDNTPEQPKLNIPPKVEEYAFGAFDKEKFSNAGEKLDDVREKASEYLKNPPGFVQATVTDYKNFYQRNKPLVWASVATVVLYKVEKRMVKKVVSKVIDSRINLGDVAYNTAMGESSHKIHQAFLLGFDHALEQVDWVISNADKIKMADVSRLTPNLVPPA